MTMPWSLITLLLLGFGLFHGTGAVGLFRGPGAAHEENLPSQQVVGTVSCAPCLDRGFSWTSHFISGASVLVECPDLGFRREVTTDERGNFEVPLPPSTSEDAGELQKCTVKLIKSSNPGRDAVSSRGSLHLQLNRQVPQVLSVGVLAFTPREQPSFCAQRPSRRGYAEPGSKKGLMYAESTCFKEIRPSTARRHSSVVNFRVRDGSRYFATGAGVNDGAALVPSPSPSPTVDATAATPASPSLPPLGFPPIPSSSPAASTSPPPSYRFPLPPLPSNPPKPPYDGFPLPPLPSNPPKLPFP